MNLLNSDPTLNEIVSRLSDQLPAKKIYLFGSRSKNTHTEDSDYDLLISVPDNSGDIGSLTDQGHEALRGINASVDLVIMTETFFNQQVKVFSSIPEVAINEGLEVYAS